MAGTAHHSGIMKYYLAFPLRDFVTTTKAVADIPLRFDSFQLRFFHGISITQPHQGLQAIGSQWVQHPRHSASITRHL
jgi:hypothetical protein